MAEVDDLIQELGALAEEWRRRGGKGPAHELEQLAEQYGEKLSALYALGWDHALGWRNELPDGWLPERYVRRRGEIIEALEDELAYLAMDYRSSADAAEEQRVLAAYEQVMNELFRIGHWSGEPDAESQLPRDVMPAVYKEYWKRRVQGGASPVQGGI